MTNPRDITAPGHTTSIGNRNVIFNPARPSELGRQASRCLFEWHGSPALRTSVLLHGDDAALRGDGYGIYDVLPPELDELLGASVAEGHALAERRVSPFYVPKRFGGGDSGHGSVSVVDAWRWRWDGGFRATRDPDT